MKRLFWLNLILLSLNSCAGRPVTKALDLSECISDPDHGGFQCSGGEFTSQHFMPYSESYGWIAKDPITDKAYWDACYLARQKNGK
jgi:hypothetical protein